MIVYIFEIFCGAVIKQIAFTSYKAVNKLAYRRNIALHYDQLLSQLVDTRQRPGVAPANDFFLKQLNFFPKLFHHHEIIVHYHIEHCIAQVVCSALPYLAVSHLELIAQRVKHIS